MPKINAYRDAIVSQLPKHDIARFDKLEAYTLALGHAHTLYTAASAPPEAFDQLVAQANEARDLLLSDATALARRNLIDGQKLDELKGGSGYRNVAFDLFTLVALIRLNWAAISGNTGLKIAEVDHAAELADRLVTALGRREQDPAIVAQAVDNRHRAFTLFVNAYDQVRRALSYLQWDEGDVDHIAPSLYAGRSTARRKPDAQPVTPTAPASPTVPSTVVAPQPNGKPSPAVPVGLPNSSPFIER